MEESSVWQGVCGFEIETSLVQVPRRNDTAAHCLELLSSCPHLILTQSSSSAWLKNGGRFYIEGIGCHPEITSPECGWNPFETTAYFLAATQILRDSATFLSDERKAKRTLIFLNNESSGKPRDSNKSWGFHENYFVPLTVIPTIEKWCREILPFLVTRQVLSGSGILRKDGFEISQKARHIMQASSIPATTNKPIVNARPETLTNNKDFTRIHVTSGDTPVIEFQVWLNFGIAMMVFSAANLGLLSPLRGITAPHDPVNAFKQISLDLSFKSQFQTEDGYFATALDVQKILLDTVGEMIVQHDDKIPVWMADVCLEWENILNLLSKNPVPFEALEDTLGWANKLLLLKRCSRDGSVFYNDTTKKIEVIYHEITSPPEAIRNAKDLSRRVVKPEDVVKAVETPPETRARNRVAIINSQHVHYLNWTHIKTESENIALDMPFLDSSLPH